MQGQQQHMLLLGEFEQLHAQQGAIGQVEGLQRLRGGGSHHRLFALSRRQVAKIQWFNR